MSQDGYMFIEIGLRELPEPHARDRCKCGSETGYLSRYIKTSGATAIRWVCAWCESYDATGELPRYVIGDIPLAALPIRANFEQDSGLECVVCGVPAVEFHHWAPRVIFPEWPDTGIHLCKHHHDEWHERMRVHGLRWPGEEA